ncbi:MAG: lipopolysaccharide biosynthesis protein [Desulfobacteraceae bacterium]|nr:lipopolysaccharide biosynthesis protein [Desulfobacteraceae bacterium]
MTPADYGLMAMAHVCIGFLAMMSELGLGAAIVQRKDIDKQQLAQVFGFVILANAGLAILLFLGAPLLASYFSELRLVPIFQLLSINFILLSLYVIPQSMLLRNMDFRRKSIVDLIASLASSSITLILAIYGFGVWALVWGAMSIHVVSLFGYNMVNATFLFPSFSFKGTRQLFRFGGFLTGSRILWYFYSKADIFIGGRFLGNQLLGIYSVALELCSIPLEKFLPIINQVAFPSYTLIQSDLGLVRSHFLKAVRIGSLFVFPLFWGLLLVAPEIISLVLGSKWHAVILPLQILCIIMPFRALSTLFGPMLNGIGRPDVGFFNVAIASVLMSVAFLIGVKWGVNGICLSWLFGYGLVFLIMSKRSLDILEISMGQFFSTMRIPFISALVMLVAVFGLKYHFTESLSQILKIPLLTVAGIISYSFSVLIINREAWNEVWLLFAKTRKAKVN